MKKKISAVFIAVLLTLSLCGCMMSNVNDLYQLPKLPEVYTELQAKLNELMTGDARYITPSSGDNQQSLLLVDLDGDDEQEAVALIKKENDEQPINVFILKQQENEFIVEGQIQEEGENIESIEFNDLDNDGYLEILLGISVGDGSLRVMSVYSFQNSLFQNVLKDTYSLYSVYDIDKDDNKELFLGSYDSNQNDEKITFYRCCEGYSSVGNSVSLSGNGGLLRITAGNVTDDLMGLFITSSLNTGATVIDVIAYEDDEILNITPVVENTDSEGNVESSSWVLTDDLLRCTDVDNDGLIEIPRYRTLNESEYVLIDWYNIDDLGDSAYKRTTYNSTAGGWYFVIPESWDDGTLLIERENVSLTSNVSCLLFYEENEGYKTELMRAFMLNETNQSWINSNPSAFEALKIGKNILAIELNQNITEDKFISQEEILRRVNLIDSDWIS